MILYGTYVFTIHANASLCGGSLCGGLSDDSTLYTGIDSNLILATALRPYRVNGCVYSPHTHDQLTTDHKSAYNQLIVRVKGWVR